MKSPFEVIKEYRWYFRNKREGYITLSRDRTAEYEQAYRAFQEAHPPLTRDELQTVLRRDFDADAVEMLMGWVTPA